MPSPQPAGQEPDVECLPRASNKRNSYVTPSKAVGRKRRPSAADLRAVRSRTEPESRSRLRLPDSRSPIHRSHSRQTQDAGRRTYTPLAFFFLFASSRIISSSFSSLRNATLYRDSFSTPVRLLVARIITQSTSGSCIFSDSRLT